MHDFVLKSGWETLLVALPFLGVLLAGFFRIDQVIATPRRAKAVRRPACGIDQSGRALMTDPDGRPWRGSRRLR